MIPDISIDALSIDQLDRAEEILTYDRGRWPFDARGHL